MTQVIDDSQLVKLAADIARSPALSMVEIVATTVRAGKTIQRDAKSAAPKGGHVSGYAGKITTSTKKTAWSVETEVGPLQSGQGALGEILEFGTARSAPHPHLMPAADAEIPTWLRYVSQALGAGI
jgi:hypothetical protein